MKIRQVAAVVFLGLLASVLTAGPAAAAFPVYPLSPQCTGLRFVPSATDAADAAEIMSGHLTIPGFHRAVLPEHPDWHENPFTNSTWGFNYQSLRWLDPLRREAVRTGSTAMRDRYLQLLESWVAHGHFANLRNENWMTWKDMTTGIRAIELVCATQLSKASWLKKSMAEHASVLSDPKRYSVIGNHALHQDIGLLGLGCVTGTRAWQSLASKRITAIARRSIDSQGVSDEGSSLYQYLNFIWYRGTRQALEDCGLPVPAALNRIDLMPAFLAQDTLPNGQLLGLGDSDPLWSPSPIKGSWHEYAATRGAAGPRPSKTFAVFSRGYLFSRVTWDPDRPDTSFLSLRYGQSANEQVHGHYDATEVSFYALGKVLLWENGVYGNAGRAFRPYVRSRAAQNILDIPSATYDKDAHARLTRSQTTAAYDTATVVSKILVGATVQRTVLHAKVGGFLVVDDQVTQSRSRNVVQRWQLEEGRTTFVRSARVATSGTGANATLLWVGTRPGLRVVSGQRKPTILGWRSDHSLHIVPSPTVEASATGKNVRLTMVLVPRQGSTPASLAKITRVRTTPYVRQFDVVTPTGTYRVKITTHSASVVKL